MEQYEVILRQPLPYEKLLDSGLAISSALEIGAAIVRESDSDIDPAGRLSVMPQLLLGPYHQIQCLVGRGAGFMAGNTEFTDHNLGENFFLLSSWEFYFRWDSTGGSDIFTITSSTPEFTNTTQV